EIENGENIAELHQIQDHMIEEYCDIVKSNSLKNYSYMIRKVMEHIMSYYDQKINMTDLAQLSHTHPGNLSRRLDRKSTRLNSSHVSISYAVFCLKKKK